MSTFAIANARSSMSLKFPSAKDWKWFPEVSGLVSARTQGPVWSRSSISFGQAIAGPKHQDVDGLVGDRFWSPGWDDGFGCFRSDERLLEQLVDDGCDEGM